MKLFHSAWEGRNVSLLSSLLHLWSCAMLQCLGIVDVKAIMLFFDHLLYGYGDMHGFWSDIVRYLALVQILFEVSSWIIMSLFLVSGYVLFLVAGEVWVLYIICVFWDFCFILFFSSFSTKHVLHVFWPVTVNPKQHLSMIWELRLFLPCSYLWRLEFNHNYSIVTPCSYFAPNFFLRHYLLVRTRPTQNRQGKQSKLLLFLFPFFFLLSFLWCMSLLCPLVWIINDLPTTFFYFFTILMLTTKQLSLGSLTMACNLCFDVSVLPMINVYSTFSK